MAFSSDISIQVEVCRVGVIIIKTITLEMKDFKKRDVEVPLDRQCQTCYESKFIR